MSEGEVSANGRNFYLTAAMVLEDGKSFMDTTPFNFMNISRILFLKARLMHNIILI